MARLFSDDNLRLRYAKDAKLVGRYNFVQLSPTFFSLPAEMRCFNERSSIRNTSNCGLHCFINDRHFECLWTNCDRYIETLKKYKLFVAPDFSLYRDMEEWRRIYNCGRNYAIAYYLSIHGVNVIPVASWAFLSDLDWSLDGFAKYCTLAITNNGCLREPSDRRVFVAGVEIIQRKIEPRRIYICGKEMHELLKYDNIEYFPNYSSRAFGGTE